MMSHAVSWLSGLYIVGALATFFVGTPAPCDPTSLSATVDTPQRVMSAIIWPFYWPMRLGWVAVHNWALV